MGERDKGMIGERWRGKEEEKEKENARFANGYKDEADETAPVPSTLLPGTTQHRITLLSSSPPRGEQ